MTVNFALPSPAVIPMAAPAIGALLPILGAVFVALIKIMLKMVRPSALKGFAAYLWRRKVGASIFFACLGGGIYLVAAAGGPPKSGSGVVEGTDWPAFRGGVSRRGYVPAAKPTADPAIGGTQWYFTDGDTKAFYASPAVVGNRVYISSANLGVFADRGAIYCLDADNGKAFWKYSPRSFRATYSSPSVSGKYVVSGEGLHLTSDARITCLKEVASDKVELLWEFRTNSHVESSPCIADGNVTIGAGDDGLYCIALEPKEGNQPNVQWHLPGDKYPDCETSPIAYEGKIYFGLGLKGESVVCVDAATGKEIWRTKTPHPAFGAPAVAEGKIIAGMGNGDMINTAAAAWKKEEAKMREHGATDAEIEEAGKRLGIEAGAVWAMDPATGNVVWKYPTKGTILGTLAVADKKIYFGTRDKMLYCLDAASGKELDAWAADDPIMTSPAVGDKHVYCVTEAGALCALPRDNLAGGPAWEVTIGNTGPFTSSPVVAGGHVYVGTGNDGFLCVGEPGTAKKMAFWGGRLGGPGKSGWLDGSPLPDRGVFAWRYPKAADGAEEAPEGTAEATMLAPAAVAGGAVFAPIGTAEKTGLAMLVPPEARGDPEQKWFHPTANPVSISPAVRDKLVFVVDGKTGDANRQLAAIDTASGKAIWQKAVASDASGELLVTESRLYVCDQAGAMSCLDLAEPGGADPAPKPLWQAKVASPVGMPGVWGDDDIVLVSSAGLPGVVALDGVRGRVLWERKLPAVPTSGPIVNQHEWVVDREKNRTDKVVSLAVGTDKNVVCLDIVDGAVRWSAANGDAPHPVVGPLVADRRRLACTTTDGKVLMYSWVTGEKHKVELTGAIPGLPPLLIRDQALLTREQTIDVVNLETGASSVWYKSGWLGKVTAPPVVADSQVYFGTDQKGLVACRPRK